MARPRNASAVLSFRELTAFLRQTAMLLENGFSLMEGAEAIAKSMAESKNASVYKRLSENVASFGTLSKALGADESWPVDLTEMVKIGESTGKLEHMLSSMALHYEREDHIRRAVYNAAAYPMILGGMIFAIIVIMLTLVMPVFSRILQNMGLSEIASSAGLYQAGRIIGWAVALTVGACVIASAISLVLMKTKARKKVLSVLGRLCPRAKVISKHVEAARIANVLSVMLKSGFLPEDALEACERVTEAEERKAEIRNMREKVLSGASLSEAFSSAALLDEIHLSMLSMGETSGCADEMLLKIASESEEKSEQAMESFVSVIEPTLVSVLTVVVGAMLLSVMLPMAGMLAGVV